jgi:hypothetical protein
LRQCGAFRFRAESARGVTERLAVKDEAAMSKILDDILNYIRQNGGDFSQWYCGVAADPKDRLFTGHGVQEKGGLWIYSGDLGSDDAARRVEQHFLDLGCKGGPGGGDQDSRYVYAYKITSQTVE